MTENLKIITSLVGPSLAVTIAWVFSILTKHQENKNNERRKLKALIFNLLELYNIFYKEKNLDEYTEKVFSKIADKNPGINRAELMNEAENIKIVIDNYLKNNPNYLIKIDVISENIDGIILELAEFSPAFAFELNGEFNIKERITNLNQYFDHFEGYYNEGVDSDEYTDSNFIRDHFANEITTKQTTKLENFISTIIKKINNKAKKEILEQLKKIQKPIDEKEVDQAINQLMSEIEIRSKEAAI